MSPHPPEGEKRVGNVFYTPGTKTLRRVQWLDKDPVLSSHNLDEQGLDVSSVEMIVPIVFNADLDSPPPLRDLRKPWSAIRPR